jgi:DNA-binding transcriptional LysR family regulator
VSAMRAGLTGRLRLAAISGASTTAALILTPFCAAHPLVSVTLETGQTSAGIAARLSRFELDAGIVYLDHDEVPGAVELYTEQHVLVANRRLIGDCVDQLAWAELSELPLCMLSSSMRGRRLVDEALGPDSALRPEVETDSIASLYSLAASGRWAAVVPYPWFHPFPLTSDTRFATLCEPTVTSRVGLVTTPSDPVSVLGEALAVVAQRMALNDLFAAVLPPLAREPLDGNAARPA